MRRRRRRRTWLPTAAAALAVFLSAVTACGTGVSGVPQPSGARPSGVAPPPGAGPAGDPVLRHGVDPGFVHGTDGGRLDILAATTVTDVETFWRQAFPGTFGRPWTDLRGVYSVNTDVRTEPPAPCTGTVTELEGNALYCPAADAVAWDRAALLPVLADRFGSAGVVVVMAHEIGHAVQQRTGITPERERADPQRLPTILTETMADCYSGATLRWIIDGHAPNLRITRQQLDAALGALVIFRDPVGGAAAQAAHGDALDRIGAFQDGYTQGAPSCAGMTVDDRRFTGAAPNPGGSPGQGIRPLPDVLADAGPGLARYFGPLARRPWRPPAPVAGPPSCGTAQGPVAWCGTDDRIEVAPDGVRRDLGDYATGVLVAARDGLATLGALGHPVSGAAAGGDAVCLAGAYTGAAFAGRTGAALGPGDLDAAVQVLLDDDVASRRVDGIGVPSAFDRLARFRAGVDGGAGACGLH